MSKDELIDAVWRGRVVGDQSVYRAMSRIRELFDSESVRTLHGRGYRFIAPTQNTVPVGTAAAAADSFDEHPVPPGQRPGRPVAALAISIATIMLIALLTFAFWPRHERVSESLVIEPLSNPAASDAERYFGAALAAELAAQLGRVEGLNVRVSDERGENGRASQRVRGNWKAIGEQLVVHIELIRASDRSLVWSRNFEQPRLEADALTTSVASALLAALDRPPSNPAGETIPVTSEASGTAYERFLRARHLWRQRTPESLEAARRLLEEAVHESPDFARAHEALASVYLVLPSWQDFDAELAQTLAVSAAREALRIDPRLGEARAILAQFARVNGDWDEALHLFGEAIAREPGSATIRHWFAEFLLMSGRLEQAMAQAVFAAELDPFSGMSHNALAWSSILAGFNGPAADHAGTAVRFGNPAAHIILAWSAARRGERAAAAEHLNQLPSTTEAMGLCRQRLLGRVTAELVEQAILTSARNDQLARIYHLVCLAVMQRPAGALELVAPAVPDIAFAILWAPEFESLRKTASFQSRLSQAGLTRFSAGTSPNLSVTQLPDEPD